MITERWKSIEGYADALEVSNLGRIRSLPRITMRRDLKPFTVVGKVLVLPKQKSGYQIVTVEVCGNKYNVSVHRAVATAFIPNPDSKPQVNHIDNDRSNNLVTNLEWATAAENQRHSWATTERSAWNKGMKDKFPDRAIADAKKKLSDGWTQREVAAVYGVSQALVSRRVNEC